MPLFKSGDIIGFSGADALGAAINVATYGVPFWGIAHVGIVCGWQDHGRLLFESSSSEPHMPCIVTGERKPGTRAIPVWDSIENASGRVWHYPLYRMLYPHEKQRLESFLAGTCGVGYDYMGAFRAAGVGFSFVESLLHRDCLQAIFCSEWVAAAYAHTGLAPIGHISRWSPNRLVRWLTRNGVLKRAIRIK